MQKCYYVSWEKLEPSLKDFGLFDHLVLAKDLGIRHFNRYIFRYNRFEAANSLKAKLLQYAFKTYVQEKIRNEENGGAMIFLQAGKELYEVSVMMNNHILFTLLFILLLHLLE